MLKIGNNVTRQATANLSSDAGVLQMYVPSFPEDGEVHTVRFHLEDTSGAGDTYQVAIYSDNTRIGLSAARTDIGAAGVYDFIFSPAVVLAANQPYRFAIGTTSATGGLLGISTGTYLSGYSNMSTGLPPATNVGGWTETLSYTCCEVIYSQFHQVGISHAAVGTANTITCDKPAGTLAGDIMFFHMKYPENAILPTFPEGLIQIGQRRAPVSAASQILFYKIANNEPDNYTFTWNTVGRAGISITTYRGGFNPEDPIDVFSDTIYNVSDTTLRAASMVVTSPNSPILLFPGLHAATSYSLTPPNSPSRFTEVFDLWDNLGSRFLRGAMTLVWSGAGATGNIDVISTFSTADKHCFAVALKPKNNLRLFWRCEDTTLDVVNDYGVGEVLTATLGGDTQISSSAARTGTNGLSFPDWSSTVSISSSNIGYNLATEGTFGFSINFTSVPTAAILMQLAGTNSADHIRIEVLGDEFNANFRRSGSTETNITTTTVNITTGVWYGIVVRWKADRRRVEIYDANNNLIQAVQNLTSWTTSTPVEINNELLISGDANGSLVMSLDTIMVSSNFSDPLHHNFIKTSYVNYDQTVLTTTRYVNPNSSGGNGTTQALSGATAAYSSLANWNTARARDLVIMSEIEQVVCESNGAADTTQVFINNTVWVTSADCYLDVRAGEAHRASTKWDTTKYRLSCAANPYVLSVKPAYTRLSGLQIENTGDNDAHRGLGLEDSGGGGYRVDGLFVKGVGASIWENPGLIYNPSAGAPASYFWNCIVAEWAGDGFTRGGGNAFFYNCTAINCKRGFNEADDPYDGVMINCLATGSTLADFIAWWSWPAASNYNASGDGSAPGTNSRINQTFSFVSATDFALTDTDTGAKGYGLTDPGTGLFSTDILGNTRTEPWDIGAHEYFVSITAADITPVLGYTLKVNNTGAVNILTPTGTPTDGLVVIFMFETVGEAITWSAAYRSLGGTLPALTQRQIAMVYNAQDALWDVFPDALNIFVW